MADLGFVAMPIRMVKPEIDKGELCELSDQIRIKPTSLYLVYPSRTGQPAKLKAIVDALVNWGTSQAVS
jgi:DNA-binding transcriptional LysR family regulator